MSKKLPTIEETVTNNLIILTNRYHRIRMAVFTPEYLKENTKWTDDDFTRLIDEIIRLQL